MSAIRTCHDRESKGLSKVSDVKMRKHLHSRHFTARRFALSHQFPLYKFVPHTLGLHFRFTPVHDILCYTPTPSLHSSAFAIVTAHSPSFHHELPIPNGPGGSCCRWSDWYGDRSRPTRPHAVCLPGQRTSGSTMLPQAANGGAPEVGSQGKGDKGCP